MQNRAVFALKLYSQRKGLFLKSPARVLPFFLLSAEPLQRLDSKAVPVLTLDIFSVTSQFVGEFPLHFPSFFLR